MASSNSTNDSVRACGAKYIADNPTIPVRVMAAKLGCSESTLYAVAKEHGVSRKPRRITAASLAALRSLSQAEPLADNHSGEEDSDE